MIRECQIEDINSINQLGNLVNENFINLFNIAEIINTDYSHIFVYEENNCLVGFVHLETHFEVIDIINIVVAETARKKGIASKLIQHIIDNIQHERILLEVNSNNIPAINLYKKFNFKEINIRKKYYNNGDAIIMERSNL